MGASKLIKNYKTLGHKEFFKQWGKGIEGITPVQQLKSQITFTIITIIGILAGIIICSIGIKTLWWLLIILIGALGNTLVGLLGLYQKMKLLKGFNQVMEVIDGKEKS